MPPPSERHYYSRESNACAEKTGATGVLRGLQRLQFLDEKEGPPEVGRDGALSAGPQRGGLKPGKRPRVTPMPRTKLQGKFTISA